MQKLGRTLAIQWIKHYTVDSTICFINTCPLDRDVHLLNNWGQKAKQTCMLKVYVHVTRRCIGCPCYFKFMECRMVSPDITQNKKLHRENRYENSYICEVLTFSAPTRRQMVKYLLNKTCLLPCGQTSDLLSVFLSCLNK